MKYTIEYRDETRPQGGPFEVKRGESHMRLCANAIDAYRVVKSDSDAVGVAGVLPVVQWLNVPEHIRDEAIALVETRASVPTPAPAKPKKAKPKSRAARWQEAVAIARDHLTKAQDAAEAAVNALADVRDIQEEFNEWRENMSENLQSSPTYEKLDTVCEIDLEPDKDDLAAIETAIGECEGAELPVGFGRD